MDSIFQFLGSAGGPTSFIGIVLFLYFTLRKQEAALRAEQIATIERLKTDIKDLRMDIKELSEDKDKQSAIIDDLRKTNGSLIGELARLQAQLIALGQTLTTNNEG